MIKIYGVAPSRTFRCLWLLEELGLKYERELVHWDDGDQVRARYLELNPNGRVPCLVDGDLVLFEWLAINHYLIAKYGGSLAPTSIENKGRALQWSFWAVNEIEPSLTALSVERASKQESEWDQALLTQSQAELTKPIKVLDDILADRDFLLGDRFTIADLNVSAVILPGVLNGYDLTLFSHVSAWFSRCSSREALQPVNAWAQAKL